MRSRFSDAFVYGRIYEHPLHLNELMSKGLKVMTQLTAISNVPLGNITDHFPFLIHAPRWLPGLRHLLTASQTRSDLLSCLDLHYQAAMTEKQERGAEKLAQRIIRSEARVEDKNEFDKWLLGIAAISSPDSTGSMLRTAVTALALHPQPQRKAFNEVQSVMGKTAFVRWSDLGNLPYISALIKEIYRWFPIAPLPAPRVASTDIPSESGYIIPQGSVIVPLPFIMMQDESLYAEPASFRPERFLRDNPEMDPTPYSFGFGKRTCPAIHTIQIFVSVAIANIIANIELSTAAQWQRIEDDNIEDDEVAFVRYLKQIPLEIKVGELAL